MICNCEDCRCWEANRRPFDEPPLVGLCRRHAPKANGNGTAEWPETRALDWCAEAISTDETKKD
ncbi:MAG: hypothetical protein RBU25_19940 [Lentisphaeria bacterium]|jgi:hypothetical protein|nr:hypothetical protein [Lentisphaeria bacterium]